MVRPAPLIEPRCLTREQAASYCGLSPAGFAAWVSGGIVPGPIRGTQRWDKRALDHALDERSGLSNHRTEPEDEFTAWKLRREAQTARGRQGQ